MPFKLLLLFVFSLCLHASFAQHTRVTLSGAVKDNVSGEALPYVSAVIKRAADGGFVAGTITDEAGRFIIPGISPGNYSLEVSYLGYRQKALAVQVGRLSEFLDLGHFVLERDVQALKEVVVTGQQDEVTATLDKKSFSIDDNISQAGGSVLQAMQNLPGVTVDREGKVQLRGSDRVTVLIDGKQTALTGFGNQSGLDNIPASAIERVEIINNPSARYDAQGMAGIINIVMKKNKEAGLSGKAGLVAGVGALGEKHPNLPMVPDQYLWNPSVNPSLSLNYRKDKINYNFQGDVLSWRKLNKNEFIQRTYDNGDVISQQYLENRTETAYTLKTGIDWLINDRNTFTISGLFAKDWHIDRGELPFFNSFSGERQRLWQFWEEEANTSANLAATYVHQFAEPGRKLQLGLNYSFKREDESFYFTNTRPQLTGTDTTMLIADENVTDFTVDYVRPLKSGRIEVGSKVRWRYIPTEMEFFPGHNSILDLGAAGWANYDELISALYGTYVYEKGKVEVEAGLRIEYAHLNYEVIPTHNTYASDGYNYFQPFPNLRFAYLLNDNNRLSFFYNRRVDRPDEQDLRIFPKYDDPEILKTGNPALRPQFTQSVELGFKTSWNTGYFYSALYGRRTNDILTRIVTINPASNLLNAISQNAGNGTNLGLETVWEQRVNNWFSLNLNTNLYRNTISAFTIESLYPFNTMFSAAEESAFSGNVKSNYIFSLPQSTRVQFTAVYLAPDIFPQGRIGSRFSVDFGLTKTIQNGRGELLLNGSDIFNTLRIKREFTGDGFAYVGTDYYQTQMFRIGYNYRF